MHRLSVYLKLMLRPSVFHKPGRASLCMVRLFVCVLRPVQPFFWLFGAETEAHRRDDPTLTSETRQGIFKVRLPKDSLTHCHAFITQSGCTGRKRQVKDTTHTRTSNLLVRKLAT